MKILEFKILKIFYLNLIALVYMLPSFGGAGGGLYAQDPQLFEHTWYFQNGELNGIELYPTPSLTAHLTFQNEFLDIGYPYCSGGISFEEVNHISNVSFEITGDYYILVNNCNFPKNEAELLFIANHNRVFGNFTGSTTLYFNPFTYTIETVDGHFQLTIENHEGDWAVYNSVLLSMSSFSQNSFALYPNPVNESVNVKNNSNQQVTATIYNIDGKWVQNHSLETNLSIIDVKELKSGLYFVVFESEVGERVSKKFVKQ